MHVFFDFDSTVVSKESLDETIARALAEHPERERLVADIEEITRLGMEGKINFTDSVRRRVAVVPLSRTLLEETGEYLRTQVTPGMDDVFGYLRQAGHAISIVSGGFSECVEPTARSLEVPTERTFTNRFLFDADNRVVEIDDSSLLWTDHGKAPVLFAERALSPGEQFVMVGDGMNDYRAFEQGAADAFIGFGANALRESVQAKAPYFVNSASELLSLLRNWV